MKPSQVDMPTKLPSVTESGAVAASSARREAGGTLATSRDSFGAVLLILVRYISIS